MELECFYGFQMEKGFSASFSPPNPPLSFSHLLTAVSDENEVVLTFIDRCHGLEEKENVCWNQTDLGEGVQILAPSPGAMQLWVNV